jgi:pimeloyl-ACP methyl ester carboxylesterase
MHSFLPALFAVLVSSFVGPDPNKVSDFYRPGEERVWVFEQDGESIGQHLFRYEGSVEALGQRSHRFTGQVRVNAMPDAGVPAQRFSGELFTDDSGHPLRSVLEAQLGDAYSRVELSFASGKASATILQGRIPKEMSVDVPVDVFLQANNFIGYHELMLALAPRGEAGAIDAKLFSANVLQVIPYPGKKVGGRLEDSLGEEIVFTENGQLLEIELAAQKLRIRRSEELFVGMPLVRPTEKGRSDEFDVSPFVVRRGAVVTVEVPPDREVHYEAVLRGEVTRPKGVQGRLPAVFFLSGSGQQDRDGFSSGIDIGTHEILDHLTRAGFAVMRMDDRGAGESTGPMENLGIEEMIADARACMDYLFGREDVDYERIALIGHSEGGVIAPILAYEKPSMAAVVLLAAPARPIVDVMLEQNGRELDRAGIQGEERKKVLAEVARYLALASGPEKVDLQDVPEDYRSLFGMRAWLREHARIDPLANVARLECPVLVLQGGKDFQVSPDRDARVLQKALDDAKNPDHELVVFSDLDHLFKKVAGEESSLAEYYQKRPVDPRFLETLSQWLSKRLKVR